MSRILVVEDDPKMSKLLCGDLELEGFKVCAAKDGIEALDFYRRYKPDLIILDVMLPKMSGYDVCRTLRKDKSDAPIIMLTAKGQESEKVIGLDMGADDYITKPFSGLELLARVRALLRRHRRELDKINVAEFGDVKIDFKRLEATKSGKPFDLTTKEFQILELLLRYRGEVVERRKILEDVWGFDEMPTTRTVDTHIMTLRQKLSGKNEESYIVTVHGIGYKFIG